MRQYLDAKQQYRDAILFFRMGDFYEMFYEDALVAARALELTLTSRSKDANGGGIPMCGVPFHAVDGYIARLVKKGFRVAICDQVEDPAQGQGPRQARGRARRLARHADRRRLPRRARAGVPDGDRARPSTRGAARRLGVALLDLSTGEFTAAEYDGPDGLQALADELAVLQAARDRRAGRRRRHGAAPRARGVPALVEAGLPITPVDGWTFDAESARRDAPRSAAGGRPRRLRPRRPSAPPSRPPARSSTTCATRRRSTSRTCAPSPTASAPTRCSSIR